MSIGTQLRTPVLVRKADLEKEPVQEWIEKNSPRNDLDPKIFDYPSLAVLASHRNGTVFTYLPVQTVAMLESVGINPEANGNDVATGLMESVKATALLAHNQGIREVYYLSSDDAVDAGAKAMGFEELTCKVWRLRI